MTPRAAAQESLDNIYLDDILEATLNPPNATRLAEKLMQVISILKEAERRFRREARKPGEQNESLHGAWWS